MHHAPFNEKRLTAVFLQKDEQIKVIRCTTAEVVGLVRFVVGRPVLCMNSDFSLLLVNPHLAFFPHFFYLGSLPVNVKIAKLLTTMMIEVLA